MTKNSMPPTMPEPSLTCFDWQCGHHGRLCFTDTIMACSRLGDATSGSGCMPGLRAAKYVCRKLLAAEKREILQEIILAVFKRLPLTEIPAGFVIGIDDPSHDLVRPVHRRLRGEQGHLCL